MTWMAPSSGRTSMPQAHTQGTQTPKRSVEVGVFCPKRRKALHVRLADYAMMSTMSGGASCSGYS